MLGLLCCIRLELWPLSAEPFFCVVLPVKPKPCLKIHASLPPSSCWYQSSWQSSRQLRGRAVPCAFSSVFSSFSPSPGTPYPTFPLLERQLRASWSPVSLRSSTNFYFAGSSTPWCYRRHEATLIFAVVNTHYSFHFSSLTLYIRGRIIVANEILTFYLIKMFWSELWRNILNSNKVMYHCRALVWGWFSINCIRGCWIVMINVSLHCKSLRGAHYVKRTYVVFMVCTLLCILIRIWH